MFGPWLSMSDNAMPGGWKTEASRIPDSVIPAKAGIHNSHVCGKLRHPGPLCSPYFINHISGSHAPAWEPVGCFGMVAAGETGLHSHAGAWERGNEECPGKTLRHSREGGNPHSHVCGNLRHQGPLCSPYSTTFLVPMLLRGNLWVVLEWLLLERQVCVPTRKRGNEEKQPTGFHARAWEPENHYTSFSALCMDSRLRRNDGAGVGTRVYDTSRPALLRGNVHSGLSTSNHPKAARRFPRRSMGTRNHCASFSTRCMDSRLRGNDGAGVGTRVYDIPRSHAPAWECIAVSPQAINPKQPTGFHARAWEPENHCTSFSTKSTDE